MTPAQTADGPFFQRRYHDFVLRSLTFGPDVEIGLESPAGRAVTLRLEDVVAFRATELRETNIVVAVSFEPLSALTPDAFMATLSRFGGGDEVWLRGWFSKQQDYGLLSIEPALGLSAVAVCRRVTERSD